MIVLDTNALVHWLVDSDGISAGLKSRLEREDRILICAVSLWEIGLKQNQGKLVLPWSIREIARRLPAIRNVEEVSADSTLWIESLELAWDHHDPADRLITALAMSRDCDLATTDGVIRAFYQRCVV